MEQYRYLHPIESPVSEPPQRVVSLVPSMTESLFDLNIGDRLIAVTDYCVHPADRVAGLPRIGGTKNPRIAHIIALRPDLVLANQEENRREDIEALQAAGIPVWVTFPKTMREAFNLLWNLMHIFDQPSMVERVRAMEWTLDWLERMAEDRPTPLRVFVPIWLDPLMTFNADTFAHDVIRVCGGLNVFAERERLYPLKADLGQAEPYAADDPRIQGHDTRYPRVTLAEVAAAAPDIILLPSEPFPFDDSHRPVFEVLPSPASGSGKIIRIDGSLLFWHGTRMARAMNELPSVFHPIIDDSEAR
ncbi:MAG: helical backbone metal receptor [bacterium]|nr:helical backbone metal receptor [bacterium]